MSEEIPAWALGTGFDVDMEGESRSFSNARFWMEANAEKQIIFLSDAGLAIWEHQVKLGFAKSAWFNFFSCLQMVGEQCPLCRWAEENSGQFRRYKIMVFSIIDCAEFTDKTGKKRKNEKRLFCAKKQTTEILKRLYLKRLDRDEGLKGAKYNVYRTSSNTSPSVGEQFEFVEMVDLAAYPDIEPFDVADIFAPDREKVSHAVERLKREAGLSESSGEEEGTDAKVPFE